MRRFFFTFQWSAEANQTIGWGITIYRPQETQAVFQRLEEWKDFLRSSMVPGSLWVLMEKGLITVIKLSVQSRKYFGHAKHRKKYVGKRKFDFDLEKLVRFDNTVRLFIYTIQWLLVAIKNFEMQLVKTEMCCKCKMHIRLR